MFSWTLCSLLLFTLALGQETPRSRWFMHKTKRYPSRQSRGGFSIKVGDTADVCMENVSGLEWELTSTGVPATILPVVAPPGPDADCYSVTFNQEGVALLHANHTRRLPDPQSETGFKVEFVEDTIRPVQIKNVLRNGAATVYLDSLDQDQIEETARTGWATIKRRLFVTLGFPVKIELEHIGGDEWFVLVLQGKVTEGDVMYGVKPLNLVGATKADFLDVTPTRAGKTDMRLYHEVHGPVENRPFANQARVNGIEILFDVNVFYGYTPFEE